MDVSLPAQDDAIGGSGGFAADIKGSGVPRATPLDVR